MPCSVSCLITTWRSSNLMLRSLTFIMFRRFAWQEFEKRGMNVHWATVNGRNVGANVRLWGVFSRINYGFSFSGRSIQFDYIYIIYVYLSIMRKRVCWQRSSVRGFSSSPLSQGSISRTNCCLLLVCFGKSRPRRFKAVSLQNTQWLCRTRAWRLLPSLRNSVTGRGTPPKSRCSRTGWYPASVKMTRSVFMLLGMLYFQKLLNWQSIWSSRNSARCKLFSLCGKA